MKNSSVIFTIFSIVTIILLSGCNLPTAPTVPPAAPAAVSPPTASAPPAIVPAAVSMPVLPGVPASGDFIQILGVNPPASSGLSPSNTITLTLRYRMAPATGVLQVWFERFKDATCTTLDSDPRGSGDKGGSTIPGGIKQPVSGGSQETLVIIPPVPPLDAAYVSMGARLWSDGEQAALAEDMLYANCYAVRGISSSAAVTPGTGPASGGTGTIAGYVYHDLNRSGTQDLVEPGESTFPLSLADDTCLHTITTTSPDANGHFSFSGLAEGTYCLVLNYSGGMVAPGTWQRVDVMAGTSSPAFFGIQPARRVTASVCGNAVLETGEECDPPNVTNCTASCQNYIASCGNGIVDRGEQCDPPNVVNCTASCQNYTAVCGNGIVDSGEQCDPPNTTDCTASCRNYTATCGNSIIDAREECDPPNTTNCTASCRNYTPFCGNAIVDPGEECDPPNVTNCTASCRNYFGFCGNGIVDSGEQCDPPNTVDCTASCQTYLPVCGNGIIDLSVGEQCDPPNVVNCTASCQSYSPVCGNGIVDWGETCDPPNTTNCTASCQTWP